MSNNTDLKTLSELLWAIQHFAERVAVQRQIVVIVVALVGLWLLSRLIWRWSKPFVDGWIDNQKSPLRRRNLRYAAAIVQYTIYPILAIIFFNATSRSFLNQGWHAGLLFRFLVIFWFILAYRPFIGILDARLGRERMWRYHYRFILPLVILLIFGWLIDSFIPIGRLSAVRVWDGFTSPITLGALAIATLGFYFWYDGSYVMQDVLHHALAPRTSVDPITLEATLTIGRYVLIAIGLLIVFTVLGFDSTMLAFATGGLSVGIGFGSKEIISNLISGILLLFDQSLRPGDVVSIEGQMGMVNHIGLRATTVNTLNNVEVIIPNQTFLTTSVTTYTKSDRFVRILVRMETDNRHSPYLVREALMEAANLHPGVADDPEPVVFFVGHGDSSHLFDLAVWFDEPTQTAKFTSELYFLMHDSCTKRGVEPSTPTRHLHVLELPELQAPDLLPGMEVPALREE